MRNKNQVVLQTNTLLCGKVRSKRILPSGKDKSTNTNNEEQVLTAIRNNPQITIPVMAKTTGFGERTVSRIIKELKSNGVLIREGTRNGKWVILK